MPKYQYHSTKWWRNPINNSSYTYLENTVIAGNQSGNANTIGIIVTNRDQTLDANNCTIIRGDNNKNLMILQVGNNDVLTLSEELRINSSKLYKVVLWFDKPKNVGFIGINSNFRRSSNHKRTSKMEELIFNPSLSMYNTILSHQNNNFSEKVMIAFNNGTLNANTNNCFIHGSTVLGNAADNVYVTFGLNDLQADFSTTACNSSLIDKGNDGYAANLLTGINGNSRAVDNQEIMTGNLVDIGAYEQQVECPLAREMSTFEKDLNIYPNPTNDIFHI